MEAATAPNRPDPPSEHHLFWMLAKKPFRRDDVGRAYLAIQAALAFQQTTVDVGALIDAMMPEGRHFPDNHCDALGPEGLAYFHWLYEITLTSAGDNDYHRYRFRRRTDGAEITALLRTAFAPCSLQFQQRYERQRRTLETKRAKLLLDYRLTTAQTNRPSES